MKAEDYYLISAITTSIAAVFAFIFGIWQIKINDRLKKLQDFVAISISPEKTPPGIRIMNVGKINLYLRKAEIGHISHDYNKPHLVSVGIDPHYFISIALQDIPLLANKETSIKLYFVDETNQKYLSTGAIIIDASIQSAVQAQNIQETSQINQAGVTTSVNIVNIRSWSYKMEKYDWKL